MTKDEWYFLWVLEFGSGPVPDFWDIVRGSIHGGLERERNFMKAMARSKHHHIWDCAQSLRCEQEKEYVRRQRLRRNARDRARRKRKRDLRKEGD